MKKTLICLSLVLCLLFLFAGCKKQEATQKQTSEISTDTVKEATDILFIEAEDPLHLDFGAFRVGDKFTTYENTEERGEVGVTVWVHKSDKNAPHIGYFTNDVEMKSLVVDSSGCKLDEKGCFTEAGVFTVKLNFEGFETTYDIRVEDGKKE